MPLESADRTTRARINLRFLYIKLTSLDSDGGGPSGSLHGVYTVIATGTATDATMESGFFWQHLRLAGFVSGTGTTQPFNAVSGMMGVQTSAD